LKQGKVNGVSQCTLFCRLYILTFWSTQKAVLSITNTNEGDIFVNPLNPLNASAYARMLFPKFGAQQAEQTAEVYVNLGTPIEQDILIMGDCMNFSNCQILH
jgi:hypothetical protein